MKGRLIAYATGGVLIVIGLRGMLTDPDLLGWALWFGGVVVVHDAVFAPIVLLTGALTTHRPRLQAALAVAGGVTLVAMPMVLGFGRRADNPSLLPLSYGRNLLIVLAVIAVVAVLGRRRGRRAHAK